MGAHNYDCEYPTTDFKELQKTFRAEMDQSLYEDGHSSYSGGLGTLTGIHEVNDPFPSEAWSDDKKEKIREYLLDHAEKWDDALAVKTPDSFIVAAWLAE